MSKTQETAETTPPREETAVPASDMFAEAERAAEGARKAEERAAKAHDSAVEQYDAIYDVLCRMKWDHEHSPDDPLWSSKLGIVLQAISEAPPEYPEAGE